MVAELTSFPPVRAADLETVLDIETTIETAVKTLLNALDIDQVAIRRGVAVITSRRVDVELTLGQATGALYPPANLPDGPVDTAYCFERAWQAQLSLKVVTDRDENAAFHTLYRARVRALMLQFATVFTPDVLPYHSLGDVRTAGTRGGLLTRENEDYSDLVYACVVSVRNTAWPDPF